LVIRAGEDLLSKYDNWGIRELRKHKLIWSSWGHARELECDNLHLVGDGVHGFRVVYADSTRLRLFFLSLLWRAAATTRPEFNEIGLNQTDLETLRSHLVAGTLPPPDFYPVLLTQLSTRGPPHNMTAIAQTKSLPDLGTGPQSDVEIFRFYFDGLVAHFHRPPANSMTLGPLAVDGDKHCVITTVTFEGSWQLSNMVTVEAESETIFPGGIDRALQGGNSNAKQSRAAGSR
jgi:hypothetical protein